MFNTKLRQAIAKAFPSRYNRLTWRNLLTDFVDVHLKALTFKTARYGHEKETNPDAQPPAIPEGLYAATEQLAKQQKLSYHFLAFAYYQHMHQVGYLTAKNIQLRELQKTALNEFFAAKTPRPNDDPRYGKILRMILLQLIGVGEDDPQVNNEVMLSSFIQQQYEAYQQQLMQYEDDWADHNDPNREHNPPAPAEELICAVVMQAVEKGRTFGDLAYQVFDLQQQLETMHKSNKLQSELMMKLKNAAKNNYQAAVMYEQGIDLDNRAN